MYNVPNEKNVFRFFFLLNLTHNLCRRNEVSGRIYLKIRKDQTNENKQSVRSLKEF